MKFCSTVLVLKALGMGVSVQMRVFDGGWLYPLGNRFVFCL